MVDESELTLLINRMRKIGARVEFTTDARGFYKSIQIFGAPKIGPFPMAPIAAAERMRQFLEG